MSSNVVISISVSISHLVFVFILSLLSLGRVSGLFLLQRLLGNHRGGSLGAAIRRSLCPNHLGVCHSPGIKVPAQQCQHPDRTVRPQPQPDHDIASWAMIEAPTLPEKPEDVVIATVRMSGAFPCTVL